MYETQETVWGKIDFLCCYSRQVTVVKIPYTNGQFIRCLVCQYINNDVNVIYTAAILDSRLIFVVFEQSTLLFYYSLSPSVWLKNSREHQIYQRRNVYFLIISYSRASSLLEFVLVLIRFFFIQITLSTPPLF